jgi:hypothetical protein
LTELTVRRLNPLSNHGLHSAVPTPIIECQVQLP